MRTKECDVATAQQRKRAKLEIRYVRKKDRTCTAEIDGDCFGGNAEDFKASGKTKVVVAVQKGMIVGYIRFDIEADRIYLSNVCVASDARGENICKKMMRWLIKKLDYYKRERISLYAINEAAVACYRKAGFKGEGISSASMEYVKPQKKGKKSPKAKKGKSSDEQ